MLLPRSILCGLLGPALAFQSMALQGQSSAQTDPAQMDEKVAFLQARAVTDPAARVSSLQSFLTRFPEGTSAHRAQELELQTLLDSFPERAEPIAALSRAAVGAAAPGFERWSEEATQADQLADAGSAGVNLSDARAWASDAVSAMTEDAYHRQMRRMELKYKLPPLPPAQRHRDFAHTRASFLAALANVQLRSGDAAGAVQTLGEARRLDPLLSEISSLQAQSELLRGEGEAALADFERAAAEGDLPPRWFAATVKLYLEHAHPDIASGGASEHGTGAETPAGVPPGLNAAIDALYGSLFPLPFVLPPRVLPVGGHTVLLELFTGSGCEPCAAPDLAVDSLLSTYGRSDLAVLEYDEHIPRPDPLANPDGLARGAVYRVETTPQAFLDGEELPVVGATRSDVENVVVSFAEALEERAAVATGWQLTLALTGGPGRSVQARVSLAEGPAGKEAAIASRRPPLIHFALVEDHVRYSGENGIRFHRMVVRALRTATVERVTGTPGPGSLPGPASAATAFPLGGIEAGQAAYLDAFEKGNDRFGEVHFRAKPVEMQPENLAVVVWIEDAGSHAILQAAYAPLPRP